MRKYRSKEDCSIVRDHPDYPASAVLMDCDGEFVHRFDEDWTDDQIWSALAFANKAFAAGVAFGESSKLHEIRSVLGVN